MGTPLAGEGAFRGSIGAGTDFHTDYYGFRRGIGDV
jgi:hypothetical protein